MGRVFLDSAASAPPDEAVQRRTARALAGIAGNPHNRSHAFGRDAADAIAVARGRVAALIGAGADDVVFTSGTTESNNLAILGTARAAPGDHLITAATEHASVLRPLEALRNREGYRLTVLGVDREGRIDLDRLADALEAGTALVSLMLVNNEIGTMHDIERVADLTSRFGARLHCDAAQAVGRIPVDVAQLGCDLLSFSAHKIHGPSGVGALWIKPGTPMQPVLHGGDQERGLRPGTANTPGIVGFGVACDATRTLLGDASARMTSLAAAFTTALLGTVDGSLRVSPIRDAAPGILNIAFEGVQAEDLIACLDGVAASPGAACRYGRVDSSHVLQSIGLPRRLMNSCVRFSLSRLTDRNDIDTAVARIADAVCRVRSLTGSTAQKEPQHAG